MLPLIAAGIGAAGSLIGGWLSNKSQDARQEQQIAQQREFASSGIQWKVDDARKAGIHPLYALGASTHSFSPTTVGSDNIGPAIASSSQDIGRAIQATATGDQKATTAGKAATALMLEKGALENQLLRSQIRRLDAGTGPAMPTINDPNTIPGQPHTANRTVDVNLPKAKDGPRNYDLGNGLIIQASPTESQQDAISKEYGDEGLPSIPGNIRFARNFYESGREDWKKYWGGQTLYDRYRKWLRSPASRHWSERR